MKLIKNGLLGLVLCLLAVNPLAGFIARATKWINRATGETAYCLGDYHSLSKISYQQGVDIANFAARMHAKLIIEDCQTPFLFTLPIAYQTALKKGLAPSDAETRHELIGHLRRDGLSFFLSAGNTLIDLNDTYNRLSRDAGSLEDSIARKFCQSAISELGRCAPTLNKALDLVCNGPSEARALGLEACGLREEGTRAQGKNFRSLLTETMAFTDVNAAIQFSKLRAEGHKKIIICLGDGHISGNDNCPGIENLLSSCGFEKSCGFADKKLIHSCYGKKQPTKRYIEKASEESQRKLKRFFKECQGSCIPMTLAKVGIGALATGAFGYLAYRAWQWWKSRS